MIQVIFITMLLTFMPLYIWYRIRIDEAVSLLERRRDHLLLKPEHQVKDREITAFIERVK